MKRTSVAELKARLSHYLRLARGGETIEVESHRHAVARLVPPVDSASALVWYILGSARWSR
jgi:antitoxin (DNA-binding transcriptional repressor) of toxin-antitoxin stability system